MDPARIQRALDSLIYLPLLKGRSAAEPPETEADALLPLPSVQARQCKPWDRGDLLRRLQSFQPATWFCKPACAGPVACARRGWANTGLDQLTCETCGAKLSFPLPPRMPLHEVEKAGAKLAERLDTGHEASCPWLGNACDTSVAQFPPLARAPVLAGFQERAAALGRLDALPPIAPAASRLQHLMEHGPAEEPAALPAVPTAAVDTSQNGQAHAGPSTPRPASAPSANGAAARPALRAGGAADTLACHGTPEFLRRQRLLALCGWGVQQLRAHGAAGPGSGPDPSSSPASTTPAADAALVCALCGAKAGMWQFVPRVAAACSSLSAPAAALRARTAPAALPTAALHHTIAGGPLVPHKPFARPGTTGAADRASAGAPNVNGAPSGPFGGAAVQPPAFGGRTGRQGAPSMGGSGPAGSGAAAAGPFGRSAGDSGPVFGIAALRREQSVRVSGAPAATSTPTKAGQKRPAEGNGDDAEPNSKRARQSVPDPAAGAPAAAQGDSQGAGPSGAQSSPAQGPSSAAGAPQTPSGTATPGTLGRPSSGKPGGGGVAPLNPLALHRSFCPWVAAADAAGGAAGRDARIGWRWCLDVLVPAAGPEEGEEGGAGADGATAFSRLDPAAKLRALLRKLGV